MRAVHGGFEVRIAAPIRGLLLVIAAAAAVLAIALLMGTTADAPNAAALAVAGAGAVLTAILTAWLLAWLQRHAVLRVDDLGVHVRAPLHARSARWRDVTDVRRSANGLELVLTVPGGTRDRFDRPTERRRLVVRARALHAGVPVLAAIERRWRSTQGGTA